VHTETIINEQPAIISELKHCSKRQGQHDEKSSNATKDYIQNT